ncbi:MAG: hypothetical protein A8274_1258 [Halanaerobium sp. 4-GBenrich]|uniref:RNA methyltransferase n=1 Tax=Halanaerobium congolense TaxID=54121 RepID=UPI00086DD229|nr:RNA methyltransferase [Halanaerobium congolense]ODS49778.1 MAG: hypothetical protein A8274_1258 [Halanaerobium sp. 4-GBenrich]SDG81009.1 hypothetical protein SAMN04515651_101115 [Halanaerobium congolense]
MSNIEADVYLGLVHNPIYNKLDEIITTTVTNYDLHDISRAAKTYDIKKYYIINNLKSQQKLVERVRDYWTGGRGADYVYNRHQAFSVLEIASELEEAKENIREETGKEPLLIATDAREYPNNISYKDMRKELQQIDRPFLIIYGTGYGLTKEMVADCDYVLYPIWGRGDFNHLSVRSAASIIMDRLLSDPWWEA